MFHHFGWKLPIQGPIFRVFPQLLGERVGVGGWGGNGHLLEAYSTKPTCKPQSTMCS